MISNCYRILFVPTHDGTGMAIEIFDYQTRVRRRCQDAFFLYEDSAVCVMTSLVLVFCGEISVTSSSLIEDSPCEFCSKPSDSTNHFYIAHRRLP